MLKWVVIAGKEGQSNDMDFKNLACFATPNQQYNFAHLLSEASTIVLII